MKTRDWILSFIEAAVWYAFIYTILYSIKHEVNLYVSSLIIVALLYIGSIACPITRHLQAWKDLWKEK